MAEQRKAPRLIIIIDKRSSWQGLPNEDLYSKGYTVQHVQNYDEVSQTMKACKPDLVIFGCSTVSQTELNVIETIVQLKHPLIVTCTTLPRDMMREIFLKGAEEVVDQPYDFEEFIKIVEAVLRSIESRNAYQNVMTGRAI